MTPGIMQMLSHFDSVVGAMFPGSQVCVFGSYATGLAVELSDVDLVVTGVQICDRSELQHCVRLLGKLLERQPWVMQCRAIDTATVPVVKLVVDGSAVGVTLAAAVQVDVTIDYVDPGRGEHGGIASYYLVKDMLSLYPMMHPLVLVVKQLLYAARLNSAYKGGLNSYSIVLWVTACLNYLGGQVTDLGETLLWILKYYGTEFNYKTTGVNILNGGSFFFHAHPQQVATTIDPLYPQSNTTRTSYAVEEILRRFAQAHESLVAQASRPRARDLLKSLFHQFSKNSAN